MHSKLRESRDYTLEHNYKSLHGCICSCICCDYTTAVEKRPQLSFRPAFVNTLFPVTRPHHIYSTALVIIILIDNLKYVIIFVYVWFLPWKISEVFENASGVQVSKALGRLIVQIFTTHVSNPLINFPMCTECKKEG